MGILRIAFLCFAVSVSGCRKQEGPPIRPDATIAEFREGDVLASKGHKVSVSKVLKIEPFPGGGTTFHMLAYKGSFASVEEAQNAYQQKQLHVLIMHAPIDGASYKPEDYAVLGHESVTHDDLEGYRTYLEEMQKQRN